MTFRPRVGDRHSIVGRKSLKKMRKMKNNSGNNSKAKFKAVIALKSGGWTTFIIITRLLMIELINGFCFDYLLLDHMVDRLGLGLVCVRTEDALHSRRILSYLFLSHLVNYAYSSSRDVRSESNVYFSNVKVVLTWISN